MPVSNLRSTALALVVMLVATSVATLVALLGACSSRSTSATPPHAEFVLSSEDSAFWVTTNGNAVRVRGVPLILARYDGHFYELFSADDDFSFDDALLLGQRLYRRDLTSGDSAVVFADTIVGRVALSYARAHPDERPLSEGQEGQANPSTSATAEIDILDVFGPYVSYEYHVDVELPGRPLWHTTRRGVIDLRSGHESSVADVFGADAGARLTAAGRHSYETIRDSIEQQRATLSGDDRRAADELANRQFDERSFTVESSMRAPSITFGVPGRGDGPAGNLLQLEPIDVGSVAWWRDVRGGLAVSDTTGKMDVDRWAGAGYTVIARYDSTGESTRVAIADSLKHEFNVATVTGPLRRIDWLDSPALSAVDRDALSRAFNQAARYDEATRVAVSSPFRPKSSFVRHPLTRLTECVKGKPSTRAGTKRRSS